jgi:cytochrome P450 family 142 subfamily A polypeptide 1
MQIDLLDGDFYAGDPDPSYAWMRAHAPVYRDETNEIWGISRHADIVEIEKNPELFCSRHGFRPKMTGGDVSMIGQDDPQHLVQRKVLHRRFMPRTVASYEAEIRATTRGLIDAMSERGQADLIAELAIPLPVITILELIGFEREEWPVFARWSEISNAAGGGPRYFTPEVTPAIEAFMARAQSLIEARRAEPCDDLISVLVADAATSGRSDPALQMEALLLLNGGSDTTRHVIGGGMLALLQHPEQLAWLRANPDAIPTAVEELVRWVTPLLNMRRTSTRNTELHGCKIVEGDEILLMYAAANRDERVFDEPQRFDIRRRPNPHIAFGFGTHFCLGASLARLELRVVFEELLARLPDLSLAPDFEPTWVPNAFTRGLRELPVRTNPN